MLVLTRRVGETLMIGPDVKVAVLGVKGNQVRIGIDAPRSVEVHREEIFAKVQAERTGDRLRCRCGNPMDLPCTVCPDCAEAERPAGRA